MAKATQIPEEQEECQETGIVTDTLKEYVFWIDPNYYRHYPRWR